VTENAVHPESNRSCYQHGVIQPEDTASSLEFSALNLLREGCCSRCCTL